MPQSDRIDLFDEHGRCLPGQLSAAVHGQTRRYFQCNRPAHDLAVIHQRIRKHLAPELSIDVETFGEAIEGIRKRLGDDARTRNILEGVALPFMLPQMKVADIGEVLDTRFMPAVSSAYGEALPAYSFTNHHPSGTRKCLTAHPQSRHNRLLEAIAERDVCGLYFPCLSEYSIPAALEQLGKLPEDFLLAGGFDTAAALVGSPDLLLRGDIYPPLLWLGALEGEAPGIGYHFEAYGYNLTFNRRPHLDMAAEYWWNGLTVIDDR